MSLDDFVIFPQPDPGKDESDPAELQQQLFDYALLHCPEYLSPDAQVTSHFIKIILYGDFFAEVIGFPLVLGTATIISDAEIEEVLKKLPQDVIDNPLSMEAIEAIIQTSYLIQEKEYFDYSLN